MNDSGLSSISVLSLMIIKKSIEVKEVISNRDKLPSSNSNTIKFPATDENLISVTISCV